MQAENSEVLPKESVARQLITPAVVPVGKVKGKVNEALPAASVVTPGILPNSKGRVDAWLLLHTGSVLKNHCTVNVWLGKLFRVPFMIRVCPCDFGSFPFSRLARGGGADPVSTGKFWRLFGPTSASLRSLGVMPEV